MGSDPSEFEEMVKTGPRLNANYTADKLDLARYLRDGLQVLASR